MCTSTILIRTCPARADISNPALVKRITWSGFSSYTPETKNEPNILHGSKCYAQVILGEMICRNHFNNQKLSKHIYHEHLMRRFQFTTVGFNASKYNLARLDCVTEWSAMKTLMRVKDQVMLSSFHVLKVSRHWSSVYCNSRTWIYVSLRLPVAHKKDTFPARPGPVWSSHLQPYTSIRCLGQCRWHICNRCRFICSCSLWRCFIRQVTRTIRRLAIVAHSLCRDDAFGN